MNEKRGNISEGEKRKGKERKHFGRRNGKKRSGNISEGETERKGKERKHFTEKKEGKKNKKGRESLWGVSQRCGGVLGTLFSLFFGGRLSGDRWWDSFRRFGGWVRGPA